MIAKNSGGQAGFPFNFNGKDGDANDRVTLQNANKITVSLKAPPGLQNSIANSPRRGIAINPGPLPILLLRTDAVTSGNGGPGQNIKPRDTWFIVARAEEKTGNTYSGVSTSLPRALKNLNGRTVKHDGVICILLDLVRMNTAGVGLVHPTPAATAQPCAVRTVHENLRGPQQDRDMPFFRFGKGRERGHRVRPESSLFPHPLQNLGELDSFERRAA
jgi:hypothetical protein